jgi:anti-sigma B factor antagonist
MEASSPPDGPLTVERRELGDGGIELTLVGELDLASLHMLEQELERVAPTEKRLILDLRRLQFIDSSGLHALLRADRRLTAAGGQLTIVRGPRAVERLFRLTGLDTRLRIVDQDEIDPRSA